MKTMGTMGGESSESDTTWNKQRVSEEVSTSMKQRKQGISQPTPLQVDTSGYKWDVSWVIIIKPATVPSHVATSKIKKPLAT